MLFVWPTIPYRISDQGAFITLTGWDTVSPSDRIEGIPVVVFAREHLLQTQNYGLFSSPAPLQKLEKARLLAVLP